MQRMFDTWNGIVVEANGQNAEMSRQLREMAKALRKGVLLGKSFRGFLAKTRK